MMKNNPHKLHGFTLLELLVVIAIISTLAAVLMIVINPVEMGRRSRDSKRIADLGTIKSSVDLALADGKTLVVNTTWVQVNAANLPTGLSKYLQIIPTDPGGTSNRVSVTCTLENDNPSPKMYQIKTDALGKTYAVREQLESTSNCEKVQNDGRSDEYYQLGDPSLFVP